MIRSLTDFAQEKSIINDVVPDRDIHLDVDVMPISCSRSDADQEEDEGVLFGINIFSDGKQIACFVYQTMSKNEELKRDEIYLEDLNETMRQTGELMQDKTNNQSDDDEEVLDGIETIGNSCNGENNHVR